MKEYYRHNQIVTPYGQPKFSLRNPVSIWFPKAGGEKPDFSEKAPDSVLTDTDYIRAFDIVESFSTHIPVRSIIGRLIIKLAYRAECLRYQDRRLPKEVKKKLSSILYILHEKLTRSILKIVINVLTIS